MQKYGSFLNFVSRYKLILIIFIILLLPVIGPIKSTIYEDWFGNFGDYASNILGIFIALIVVLYELDKGTTKLNSEKRIEIYEDLSQEANNIKEDFDSLRNNYFEIYPRIDIDKYKDRYRLMAGHILYMEKSKCEKEWEYEIKQERLRIFQEICRLEEKLYYSFNTFLSNRVLLTPVDRLEEKELNYKEIEKQIRVLQDYHIFLRDERLGTESKKDLMEKDRVDKELVDKLLEEIDDKSGRLHKARQSMDLISLYLEYTRLYFQCDLIYIEESWKEDLLSDYTNKFDMILNREKNLVKILKANQ